MKSVITPAAARVAVFGSGDYVISLVYDNLKPGTYDIEEYDGTAWQPWGSFTIQGNVRRREIACDNNLLKRVLT